ncbi:MAG: hypothetical protein ACRDRA_05845 [Pseudonocardiaceae bacterium]
MGELRSRKQQREQLVVSLRAEGKSWVEVAEALRQHYRFNARVALRYAHGWSQRQAADEWNKRWPDELKTFKMFSYWEMWPSTTGHAPSFDNLSKLAELYECAVSDLLADLPDFRHLDTTRGAPTTTSTTHKPNAKLVLPKDSAVLAAAAGLRLPENFVILLMQCLGSLVPSERDALSTPADRDRVFDQLVQFLNSWAHNMERRGLLLTLGWAAAAAAASMLSTIDPDEQERVAAVFAEPGRLDIQTIQHIEEILWNCKRLDDTLGPQAAIDTVLAQRNLTRVLVRECPDSLRLRLLAVLGNASRQAGWLCFDLNDFAGASYYYDDARTLAHEAEDTELGAFVLCKMSQLANWQHKPRIGIDHAVVAGEWAKHTDDVLQQAYVADMTARAYAADGQLDACLATLDSAQAALARSAGTDRRSRFHHFYNDSFHTMHGSWCYLKLGLVDQAINYAAQSLAAFDPSDVRNVAMTTAYLSTAYIQSNQIEEAARLLGDACQLATRNHSVRLMTLVRKTRATMQPWAQVGAVRSLDERMASYGVVLSGNT